MTALLHGRRADEDPGFVGEYVELSRIVLLSGLLVAVFVALPVMRLSMLALRFTSPESAIGIQSDDDFTVGEFTLSGTYNLGMLSAFLGVLGAAVYVLVAPWLIGGPWLRVFTFAFTAGVFVGSLVIHDEGVDFTLLGPTWFAIALFVAVPFVVAAVLPWLVDRVATRGPTRASWLVIAVLQGVFLLSLLPIAFVLLVMAGGLVLRRAALVPIQGSVPAMWGMRVVFLVVPLQGLLALMGDVGSLV